MPPHSIGANENYAKNSVNIDFQSAFHYNNRIGGLPAMNEFEKDVQSKSNDFIDALRGFNWSFGFFAVIFIIGIVIKQIMS
jgi:hypothetical protein